MENQCMYLWIMNEWKYEFCLWIPIWESMNLAFYESMVRIECYCGNKNENLWIWKQILSFLCSWKIIEEINLLKIFLNTCTIWEGQQGPASFTTSGCLYLIKTSLVEGGKRDSSGLFGIILRAFWVNSSSLFLNWGKASNIEVILVWPKGCGAKWMVPSTR